MPNIQSSAPRRSLIALLALPARFAVLCACAGLAGAASQPSRQSEAASDSSKPRVQPVDPGRAAEPGPGHEAWILIRGIERRLSSIVSKQEQALPGSGDFMLVLPDQQEHGTPAQIAGARALIIMAEQQGLFRDLDRVAKLAERTDAAEFADRPIPHLLDWRDDASTARHLARLCRARTWVALERGDWLQVQASVRQIFSLSRLSILLPDSTDVLSGEAIAAMGYITIENTLEAHPPQEVLQGFMDAVNSAGSVSTPEHHVRAFVRRSAQEAIEIVAHAMGEAQNPVPFTPELLAFYEERLIALALMDRTQRAGHPSAMELKTKSDILRAIPFSASWGLAGTMAMHDRLLVAPLDLFRVRRDGIRCLLALEMHQRVRDVYPAALDDLVPRFLPSLPHDIMSGTPWVYQPAPNGASFRLYSLGFDGVDNGGAPGDDSIAALSRRGIGADYVVWPLWKEP